MVCPDFKRTKVIMRLIDVFVGCFKAIFFLVTWLLGLSPAWVLWGLVGLWCAVFFGDFDPTSTRAAYVGFFSLTIVSYLALIGLFLRFIEALHARREQRKNYPWKYE